MEKLEKWAETDPESKAKLDQWKAKKAEYKKTDWKDNNKSWSGDKSARVEMWSSFTDTLDPESQEYLECKGVGWKALGCIYKTCRGDSPLTWSSCFEDDDTTEDDEPSFDECR